MSMLEGVLYELGLRYAFLPQLEPEDSPSQPYLKVLWLPPGRNEWEEIWVTQLLHTLDYSAGYPLEFDVINDPFPCEGQILHEGVWAGDYGYVTDGSPSHNYNTHVHCKWQLQLFTFKRKLFRVTALSFETEVSKGCVYDGVRIRFGPDHNSPIGGKDSRYEEEVDGLFCGSIAPGTVLVETVQRGLYIEFFSDEFYSFSGVELKWEVLECEDGDPVAEGCDATAAGFDMRRRRAVLGMPTPAPSPAPTPAPSATNTSRRMTSAVW